MLQKGGNAVDAGVATILAASVIEFSHFSFGGEVPILIKLKGAEVVVVEGMGQAPLKATREFFVNRAKSSKLEGAANCAGFIESTKWRQRHGQHSRSEARPDTFDGTAFGNRSCRTGCLRNRAR
jgi:gamma-glutamyltranspeptidase